MTDRDQDSRTGVQREESMSSSTSTQPATSQSHGTSLRRENIYATRDGQGSRLAGGGDDLAAIEQADTVTEERMLRAWFNVPVGLGEVTGPEGTSVVRDAHAFMNCILTWLLFSSIGMDASVLVENGAQVPGDLVAAALGERGRIVTLVCDLQTGRRTLYHARGRRSLTAPNDLQESIVDWVIEPTAVIRQMILDGRLPAQFTDISKAEERATWRQWLGPVGHLPQDGQDTQTVSFLGTMDMFPVVGQADVEADEFMLSHHERDGPVAAVSRKQVTALRGDDGMFRGMALSQASNIRTNYTALNQDTANGMWAEVVPFSVAGARALLDALIYPSMWTQRRPVVLDIAPSGEVLPAEVTMERAQVINPWKAEDVRVAFHLVQSAARAKALQQDPRAPLAPPCITVIVTPAER